MAVTHDLRIDWDGDGLYTGVGEDVPMRRVRTSGITMRYGRDQARSRSPVAPGELSFTLDNTSRDYSPENTGSPIYPNVKPARGLRWWATDDLVTDAFGRTVSSGWGNADTGQVWTNVGGSASDYSVGSGVGNHSLGSVNAARRTVVAGSRGDVQVLVGVTVPVLATGASIDAGVLLRYVDSSNHYIARLRINPDATLSIWLLEDAAGSISTLITDALYNVIHTAGAKYWIRARVDGTLLRMRAWKNGTAEPTAWQLSAEDATLPAGQVGLRSILATGNTNTLPVVLAYDDVDTTSATLFAGHLDAYKVKPARAERTVELTAVDVLADLKGISISTALYSGLRTGDAIGKVLDAAGWPAEKRDLDPGVTYIRYWWEEGGDAFDAVQKLLRSEGPTALATVDGEGNFVFRDRHHRLTRSRSLTVQATFRDSGGEVRYTDDGREYDQGWNDVYNSVTFSVDERLPAGALTNVFDSTDATYSISAGETLEITAQGSDPFLGAIVPVLDVDYTLRSGTVAVSLSRTSGQSAVIRLQASGGTAVIQGLRLRAYPLPVARTYQVHGEDTTSIKNYNLQTWPDDAPWAGVHDARALVSLILAQYAERRPAISFTLVSGNAAQLAAQLATSLSDRVHVVDSELGLDADCFVEQLQHRLRNPGLERWETVVGCEKAPALPTNVFTFDVAGRGFDQGHFGATGVDDPGTMFRFDTAGHGFDQGVFST